ncbi:bactericidal permeability-increasing protein isoform X1 [Tachysurus fulvidraco]|uniref:bactericidal permeability-increasing protein isoform X1 n=2 Tax=Tachysurus fulvidraco TaxID=1234273 RepID=UPI000F4F38C5|nr:bactericidal permeability-increasing protein isoform X1 [Tachysurus fulvidraco]
MVLRSSKSVIKAKMWLIATFLLLGITQTNAEYPALQAVLTQKGLQSVSHWVTDWLQNELSIITLPEITGSIDIIFGSIHYSLHDMTIVRCDLPEPSVSFSEGTGMSLKLQGLSLAITGRWNTDFGFIHDGGWFEMAVYTINLDALLEFQDTEEHLYISTGMCIADVADIQLNFHGGASFLFQKFVERFRGQVKNLVQQRICPEFQKGIETIDRSLAASDVIEFDSYVYLNLSLTDSPVVFDSGFELHSKGEFYSAKSPSEPPFSPHYFKLPWQADYMLSVGMSDFCINSATYAYLKSGVLSINITDGMIPKSSPIHLNTSQFGFLIPKLPKLYPDMEMEVLLYASDTPLISFNQNVINVNLSAAGKFSAIKTPTHLIPLFRLDMQYSFNAKVCIDQQLLKGVLEMKNLTMLLGSTEIGEFEIAPFENLMKTIMSSIVLPKLNAQLKEGIPLPNVKGFSMNNSVMTIENGFLFLAADINSPFQYLKSGKL